MKLLKSGRWLVFTGLAGIISLFIIVSYALAAKMDRILPQPVPGAEYVGMETCSACHEKQVKEFEQSTHNKFFVQEEESMGQGCETCHGPGSKHVDAGGGKGVAIINPKKDPQPCFNCHLEKKAEFNLQYHHPVLEGKVSCVDCHDAHKEEIRPWTAVTMEGANEKCFKCHPDKRGPFVWEHDAVREGCTICHNPHGSVNNKLLVAHDTNLCLRCHYEQAYPIIGDRNHTGAQAPSPTPSLFLIRGKESCMSHHEAIHGSNFGSTLLNE